jgi:glutamyl-tRNA synthetase
MHLGNVFSALLSWLSAHKQEGRWLLRIEDIDPQRSRQEYADRVMDDLEWLGLTWDGEVVYQSQRTEIYAAYLEKLREQGVLYECHRTRADILATQAPHESDGRVVVHRESHTPALTEVREGGTTIAAVKAGAAALRVEVPHRVVTVHDGHYGDVTVDLYEQVGDFIVRRKDGAFAYQLAVVVDDALTGVTEVVRGRDLLLSSPQQAFMAELLGLSSPRYIHFPLLTNDAGQRLSKRDKSMDMGELRLRHTPQEIIGMLGHLAGLLPHPTPTTAEELLPLFDWDKVPREDIRINKLTN